MKAIYFLIYCVLFSSGMLIGGYLAETYAPPNPPLWAFCSLLVLFVGMFVLWVTAIHKAYTMARSQP